MYKLEYGRVYAEGEQVPDGFQIKGPPLREPVPLDVKDIISYTKLRKRRPDRDAELRNERCVSLIGSITMAQMYDLLAELKKRQR